MVEIHTNPRSPSWLSPGRWFLGPDGLLRPLWRALLFLIVGFFVLALVQRATASGQRSTPPLIFFLAINTLFLLQSWFFLAVLDRHSFRNLGLWFYSGWDKEVALGVGLGLGLILLVVGGLVVLRAVAYGGWAQTSDVWIGLLRAAGMLLLAAAFEEIVFRGYAFQRLVDSLGSLGAIAVFAGLFGLGHWNNPSATLLSTANTVLAGVLLAAAYLKTRALWLPWGLHWAWNMVLGPVCALPVSGVRIGQPIFQVTIGGPQWLSGGAYGPEGSVVLTVVCAAVIVWLWRTPKIRVSAAMQNVLPADAPAASNGGRMS